MSEPRKHRRTNIDLGKEAQAESKRQRKEESDAFPSSALLNPPSREKVRKRRPKRGRLPSREEPDLHSPGFTDVEELKIRLFDIASRVHRGTGPERRFMAYWEALSRFLSFKVQQGPTHDSNGLDGVHEVLNSFLVTKQMRKLHNLLIMGKY